MVTGLRAIWKLEFLVDPVENDRATTANWNSQFSWLGDFGNLCSWSDLAVTEPLQFMAYFAHSLQNQCLLRCFRPFGLPEIYLGTIKNLHVLRGFELSGRHSSAKFVDMMGYIGLR